MRIQWRKLVVSIIPAIVIERITHLISTFVRCDIAALIEVEYSYTSPISPCPVYSFDEVILGWLVLAVITVVTYLIAVKGWNKNK